MKKVAVAFMSLFASVAAFATTGPSIDVTEGMGYIDSAQTAIVTIGGALVALAAIVLAYRWVKANFF